MRVVAPQRVSTELTAALTSPCRMDAIPDGAADDDIARLVADADAFVGAEFKAAWTVHNPRSLRLVQSSGAGTDGIAREALPPACAVCNVYGHERAVAEHTFMLMLALQRRLFAQDAGLRKGNWGWANRLLPELRGRRLLILGLGRIGRELTRWAQFFEMPVSAVTRTPSPKRSALLGIDVAAGFADLPKLLPEADFVAVAVPATPETENLIGDKEFGVMKRTAFLINVGRGPVVNEAALYNALKARIIAGAGIDVWYTYPGAGEDRLPSQYPVQELDNIIMTPHNGGSSPETMRYRWAAIAENLRRLEAGEPLLNIVHRT